MSGNSKEHTPEDFNRLVLEITRSSLTGDPLSKEAEELLDCVKNMQVINMKNSLDTET